MKDFHSEKSTILIFHCRQRYTGKGHISEISSSITCLPNLSFWDQDACPHPLYRWNQSFILVGEHRPEVTLSGLDTVLSMDSLMTSHRR